MKSGILCTLTLVCMFIAEFVVAQPPLFPIGEPPQAPIDGGLSLLAAAGGAYAIKKLRDKKKHSDGDI